MKQARISEQKKQESVAYALAHPERSIKQLAGELGVGYSTLDRWVRQARAQGAGGDRKLTPEQERIRQFEKEVAHLREVNEIVKNSPFATAHPRWIETSFV